MLLSLLTVLPQQLLSLMFLTYPRVLTLLSFVLILVTVYLLPSPFMKLSTLWLLLLCTLFQLLVVNSALRCLVISKIKTLFSSLMVWKPLSFLITRLMVKLRLDFLQPLLDLARNYFQLEVPESLLIVMVLYLGLLMVLPSHLLLPLGLQQLIQLVAQMLPLKVLILTL